MSRQSTGTAADKAERATGATPHAREAPALKNSALQWNSDGFIWREALVRLPAGAIRQDLDDPTWFKGIQSVPQTRLRVWDRITLVADGWAVRDALVIEADDGRVVLHIRPSDFIRMPVKAAETEKAA